jgi:hypothetical protein
MPSIEKTINGFYFEFEEQDGAIILVTAFAAPVKPELALDPATEQDRMEALQNMCHSLARVPEYVVYFGGPGPVAAQGTEFVATGIRGSVSRKSRARITLEEVVTLIGKNLTSLQENGGRLVTRHKTAGSQSRGQEPSIPTRWP